MLFSVAPPHATDPSLAMRCAFDAVIERHGLIPASEKDVNDAQSAIVLGINVDAGRYLAPHSPKASMLVEAVSFMCATAPELSDLELAAVLGQCTWFGIMSRASLSTFDGDLRDYEA